MITLVRFAVFFLSLFGYFLYLHDYRGVTPALLPAVVFSGITVVTFLSGILNTLLVTTYLILLGGIALLVVCVITKVWGAHWRAALKPFVASYPLWFFLLGAAALAIAFNDAYLVNYDDFSHWGIAASTIVENDRFLNFSDPFIMFAAYPLGSASFIYYCSRCLGTGDGLMLFAQGMSMLGYLTALFACVKRNRAWGYPLVSIAIVLLFSYNIQPRSLCVDSLLAAIGIACLVFLLEYRKDLAAHWPETLFLLSLPVTIKNSGLFFAFVGAVFAAYALYGSDYAKPKKLWLAASLLTPFLIAFLWHQHVGMAFSTGLVSKHSLSLQYYQSSLAFNGLAGIRRTIEIVLPRIVSPLQDRAIPLIAAFGLLALFSGRLSPGKRPFCRRMFLFMAGATLLYEVGMLFMYCFSMQIDEVEYQQGRDYFRYNGTLIAFMLGMLLYTVFDICNATDFKKPGRRAYGCVAALLLAAAFAFAQNGEYYFLWNADTGASPDCAKLRRLMEAGDVQKSESYVILFSEDAAPDYHQFLTNYCLRPWRSTRFYDRAEAEKAWAEGDDLYFLDLQTETVLAR